MAAMAIMAQPIGWDAAQLASTFLMWAVMMVAMMLPAATPMLLMFARLKRRRTERAPFLDAGLFTLAYLAVWLGFAALATFAQYCLHRAALLEPQTLRAAPALGGAIMIAAGIYQWTPLKLACLRHCQSPLGFLMGHWRDGPAGALSMGLTHGGYCLGCCVLLMGLMFAAGVMSVVWMACIAIFFFAERLLPGRPGLARVPGLVLVGLGAWTAFSPWRDSLIAALS
jgi:predicted metal-binding membrane protein